MTKTVEQRELERNAAIGDCVILAIYAGAIVLIGNIVLSVVKMF